MEHTSSPLPLDIVLPWEAQLIQPLQDSGFTSICRSVQVYGRTTSFASGGPETPHET